MKPLLWSWIALSFFACLIMGCIADKRAPTVDTSEEIEP